MRADARRNREKVVQAASEAFAESGLGVSVHEVARRAGVGTGTVSRHFPTKDDLCRAVVLSRVERLAGRASELADTHEPGPAFFAFFTFMVTEGTLNKGLAEAFTGAGFDMEGAATEAGYDVGAILRGLLERAQRVGAVRADADVADVKALMAACFLRGATEPHAAVRLAGVVRRGLEPASPDGSDLASRA